MCDIAHPLACPVASASPQKECVPKGSNDQLPVPMETMINTAIASLKDKRDLSFKAVRSFISKNFNVDIKQAMPSSKKYLKASLIEATNELKEGDSKAEKKGGGDKKGKAPKKPGKGKKGPKKATAARKDSSRKKIRSMQLKKMRRSAEVMVSRRRRRAANRKSSKESSKKSSRRRRRRRQPHGN